MLHYKILIKYWNRKELKNLTLKEAVEKIKNIEEIKEMEKNEI